MAAVGPHQRSTPNGVREGPEGLLSAFEGRNGTRPTWICENRPVIIGVLLGEIDGYPW